LSSFDRNDINSGLQPLNVNSKTANVYNFIKLTIIIRKLKNKNLIAYRLPLIAYRLLLTTYCLSLIAYRLPLTPYPLPLTDTFTPPESLQLIAYRLSLPASRLSLKIKN
jgi:predicted CDP-diglyceride synthetase/phosphatidate cytidylyltransferase